jgi:hypothetical protein
MKNRIAVATISMARNDGEAKELATALKALAALGLPVFVADQSTHEEFRAFLEEKKFNVISGAVDLVSQARLAVKAAAQAGEMVLYTEPDKRFFFAERLETFLNDAVGGVSVPSRSATSFATYSLIQQRVETAVNILASKILRVDGDFTYGPILFRSELASCLENFPGTLGWGWRMYLLRMAAAGGNKIKPRTMDLPCPENRCEDSPAEWLHRMRQYAQNIGGLLHGCSARDFEHVKSLYPEMRSYGER